MGYWRQLRLVLWKSYLIRRRHWLMTIFEIVLPVLLFFLVAYGRSKVTGIAKSEIIDPSYHPQTVLSSKNDLYYQVIDISSSYLFYTPSNNFTDDLIKRLQIKIGLYNENVKGFNSEKELLTAFKTSEQYQSVYAIIFKSNIKNVFDYEIRIADRFTSGRTGLFKSDLRFEPDNIFQYYFHNGLISIQTGLDLAYIESLKGKPLSLEISIQEFPYPPYKNDIGFTEIFMPALPYITLISFIFLCPSLITKIIEEKTTGTRELLKMVGLKCWMLWLGWFLHAFLPNFVSVVIIVILMKAPLYGGTTAPIEFCSWSIFLVFLSLYLISCITFCFAISSLFKRPFFGLVLGYITWIISYEIPDKLISIGTTKGVKLLTAIFPNMCLSYGYSVISVYESRDIGANWTNLFTPGTESVDDLSMGNVLVMFIFDIIFYMLFTLYVSTVLPGPYGIPGPWNFLIYIKQIFPQIGSNRICTDEHMELSTSEDADIENQINQSEIGIQISHLKKCFGNTLAVNNLSLDIKKNQITVLLGHNGAGKTTTMSMITGMLNFTKGSIKVHNFDIKKQEKEVRKLMGLCPQHNLLFNDLTVYEHLLLIGGLKDGENVKEEALSLLKLLKLEKKKDFMVNDLSGGMKRKLCLAMAVIGNSQVLILDEPTAGMDPESQREVWNLLLKWRGSKTILISTHYMDEADALADWIAIMANGERQCFGTPMALKDQFKTGYHMSLMMVDTDKLDEITNFVKEVIPTTQLKERHGNNIVYILPIEEKSKFSKLLNLLESKKEEFKINSLSINITTLEDVFLSSRKEIEPAFECDDIFKEELKIIKSSPNFFYPLLLKRFYFFLEKPSTYIFPVILAFIFILLTIYLGQKPDNSTEMKGPDTNFDLNIYGKSSVYYSRNLENGVRKEAEAYVKNLSEFYERQVQAHKGEPLLVTSTSDGIIKRGVENIDYYKHHLIVAAEFNATTDIVKVNALYSHFATHAAPISLNLVMNAILKKEMGNEYSISVSSQPLTKKVRTYTQEESEVKVGVLWLILFPLGLAFFAASFVVFPHMEISTGFIQLQIMCGATSTKYWLANFLFDYLYYIFATSIIVCVTWACTILFGWDDFANAMSPLPLIMLFYGLGVIPFAYLFTRLKSASSGYAALLIISLLCGIIFTVTVTALLESGSEYYINIGKMLHILFSTLFPQYGLSYISVNYARKVVQNYNWNKMEPQKKSALCRFHDLPCCKGETPECLKYKDYLLNDELGILSDLFYLLLPCLIYLLINIFLNSESYNQVKEHINQLIYRKQFGSTETLNQKNTLYTENLSKYIGSREIVKSVKFDVERGKCYGLLGVNGAGKTTTFRMLTKEIMKSNGKAAVFTNGREIVEDGSSMYLQNIGYCPQNNCLNFALTARQMLKVFAYFRGYQYNDLDEVANYFLKIMQLNSYADKPCGVYSGGNKRKLCLAIALIGYPPNIFLDEPTNGVDPVSRRNFWNIIKEMQTQKNLTFLLTSHSMQECEALCSNLGIMKDGQLECNDTIPKLKEKYNCGFTVKIKLREKYNGNELSNKNSLRKPRDIPDGIDIEHAKDNKYLLNKTSSGKSRDVADGIDVQNLEDKDDLSTRIKSSQLRDLPDEICTQNMENRDEVDGNICTNRHSSRKNDNYSLEEVKNVLENHYKAQLKDEHPGLLHYHVKTINSSSSSKKRMSELFEDMEKLKNHCGLIEDYIVTEATIEDVFLSVAKSENSNVVSTSI